MTGYDRLSRLSDFSSKARIVEAGHNDAGQRIDNFLIKQLKGVPRTRIYKALRKGEVRVNGGRKKPTYQLSVGDQIRVPPIRHAGPGTLPVIPPGLLDHIPILFEDDHLLVVDKPAGLAVHGGSGMEYGLIEAFRQLRQGDAFLELVHRLDRETSGCLMLARSRRALTGLQRQLSEERSIRKHYVALIRGQFDRDPEDIRFPLRPSRGEGGVNTMSRHPEGQPAWSVFSCRQNIGNDSLVEIDLKTGRMHQARVHAALSGHPIAGDRLYGDRSFNRALKRFGLGRLFLHAERLRVTHPITGVVTDFYSPLNPNLADVIRNLGANAK